MVTVVDNIVEAIQFVFTGMLGWLLFSQLWQLCNPIGQHRALMLTRKTMINCGPVFILLTHLVGTLGVWIGFGPLAASLLVFLYCVEWAKICTVLRRV